MRTFSNSNDPPPYLPPPVFIVEGKVDGGVEAGVVQGQPDLGGLGVQDGEGVQEQGRVLTAVETGAEDLKKGFGDYFQYSNSKESRIILTEVPEFTA